MPTPSKRFIVNASWLIKLRWVAAIGQLLTIATVVFLLQIQIPMIWALLTVILVTAISNLLFSVLFAYWFHSRQRPSLPWDQILGIIMVMDMLSLTALLFASGGPANPFSLFFFVNLCLCAIVLDRQWAWSLNALSIACFAFIMYDHHQLEVLDFGVLLLPIRQSLQLSLRQIGLFTAFATCSSVIVYFMTRLTDELRRQQIDLAKAQEQTAKSEKIEALGTLAAGAAHELATPLSTIAVVARDVEQAFEQHPANFPGGQEVADDVHLIRNELDRCRKILDRMASHAGETVGEAIKRYTMEKLVNTVLDELPDRSRVDVTISDPIAVKTIEVPFDSICQALRGLVQNALDAGDKNLRVNLLVESSKSAWWWRITDVGVGMNEDVLKRISEPFFTTKAPGHGMGLGLFLANNVIQRLGGEIKFQSAPGTGTTVTVKLPQVQSMMIESVEDN